MEIKSLKGLEQVVDRVEAIVKRLRTLDQQDGVCIPDVPIPMALASTEEWMERAEECCKKPKVAKSRQLLEEKGISAAPISKDVLEQTEAIEDVLASVEKLPIEFQTAARRSIAMALTKGFEDAETVVETFSTAATKLNDLHDTRENHEWVYSLTACEIVDDLTHATTIVEAGIELCQYCDVAAEYGIDVGCFDSLAAATDALLGFSTTVQEYKTILVAEEVADDESISVDGMSLQAARDSFQQATVRIQSEALRLTNDVDSLKNELELLGSDYGASGSTLAELRQIVKELRRVVESARQQVRSSLGPIAFQVVESISAGRLPTTEQVGDDELGASVRRAVECGYKIRLEAPRENQ